MIPFLLLALVLPTSGCWLSSKAKAVDQIEKYVAGANFNTAASVTAAELESGIKSLPRMTAWMLRAFTDTDDIFARCDVNADGTLTMAEIRAAPKCVASCVKQLAIIRFLKT